MRGTIIFGNIARNQIWNGGASHQMPNWQQVVFEHKYRRQLIGGINMSRSTIRGVSLIAMGQVSLEICETY